MDEWNTCDFSRMCTMSTGKHYFVEQTDDGRYAVRAKGSQRASDIRHSYTSLPQRFASGY